MRTFNTGPGHVAAVSVRCGVLAVALDRRAEDLFIVTAHYGVVALHIGEEERHRL